jgi:hypothetical protein
MSDLFLISEFHMEKEMSLKQMVMIDQQVTPSANLSELGALFLYYNIYFCNYLTYQFDLFGTANILHVQLLFKTHQKILFRYTMYDIAIVG